ncbi:MAG: SIS domain-containing protein, partial [Proteobacteria bacterium]|nr:SIS domain-containing protein [Pseudomonadota bacterium]
MKSFVEKKADKLSFRELVEIILKENRLPVAKLSDETVPDFIHRLQQARSIFFSAQGRAGFILRCFCMRLMHLGFEVYFCGETITPAINQDDLLVVLSGSGETPSTFEAVKSAKEQNATTCGILGNQDSRMAALVDTIIHIQGTTKLCRDGEPDSLQMAGSLFEQAAFLFLEA